MQPCIGPREVRSGRAAVSPLRRPAEAPQGVPRPRAGNASPLVPDPPNEPDLPAWPDRQLP